MMMSGFRAGAACAALALLAAAPAAAQHGHDANAAHGAGLQIPEPLRIEHEEIHSRLDAATRTSGAVGAAARELAAVLGPHFERENQIALPQLSLLGQLSRGDAIPSDQAARALAMSDSLRAELPRMLEEHVAIHAASVRLEQVAREHGAADAEELAHELQLHAQTEEQVLYPAAVLVGRLLRRN
jgi:hypothetical protein